MARITAKRRKRMKNSTFALPRERKYPIPDTSHARNALAQVAKYGTPSQQRRVRAAVHREYPSIQISGLTRPRRKKKTRR
ncbi:hypothetical protein [Bifidobacterium tissieri]|uniref:Uncharacterized protein n=1 Tax=Bifidobacterium tissieri TaxID=1630162 RepID=A0A5M9ZXP0_9BIFI|nr:hypothetical protein [Bifidobacterium tissieri]KAA8828679.1 hypothetical protein EM849_11620 [Bifidobacterium tissieri]KAA8831622.1 hypothetical protein EMO89_02535 [Bifidobacterium tissieri]